MKRYLRTAGAVLLLAAYAGAAHAQLAGGGGGSGLLSQIIEWFMTNIATGLLMVGVIVVGMMMVFGRHTMAGIATMIIGGIIVSQYQTIAAFFGIGG